MIIVNRVSFEWDGWKLRRWRELPFGAPFVSQGKRGKREFASLVRQITSRLSLSVYKFDT
jgi:hypothetical protein